MVIVTGYFGDRLAQIIERYGAARPAHRRRVGPRRRSRSGLRDELKREGADVVGVVHAETSTGVRNPVKELAAVAREHGALDDRRHGDVARRPRVDLAGWGIDVAYSCSQKCIGAPSGMSPIAVSGPARARLVKCRSFYLDLKLLEDYWVSRKYHHTMSSTLIYALREALLMVEEEGLAARQARHERHHRAFAAGVEAMGLSLLPPRRRAAVDAERRPRAGRRGRGGRAQDAAAPTSTSEVGAGLGPLAGKIWRVGLMGASSTPQTVLQFLAALEGALAITGPSSAGGRRGCGGQRGAASTGDELAPRRSRRAGDSPAGAWPCRRCLSGAVAACATNPVTGRA